MHLVSYLEKENRYGIETLSVDTVLNEEHFMEKACRKCAPKVSPRPLFILVNNPKQSLYTRTCFKNILKEDYQKPLKN